MVVGEVLDGPGLIEDQKDAFVIAGSPLLGELTKRHGEQLLVYGGQDQPPHLSGSRADEAVEVGPLVASVDSGRRSLTHRSPYPSDERLEAQSGLILGPKSST